jgi:hypothetical protein
MAFTLQKNMMSLSTRKCLGASAGERNLTKHVDFINKLIDNGIRPGIVNYNILINYACKMGLKQMRRNGLKSNAVTWRTLGRLHHADKLEMIMSSQCDNDQESRTSRTSRIIQQSLKSDSDESVFHRKLD